MQVVLPFLFLISADSVFCHLKILNFDVVKPVTFYGLCLVLSNYSYHNLYFLALKLHFSLDFFKRSEFIFVYYIRQKSNFVLSHLEGRLSQYHSLNSPFHTHWQWYLFLKVSFPICTRLSPFASLIQLSFPTSHITIAKPRFPLVNISTLKVKNLGSGSQFATDVLEKLLFLCFSFFTHNVQGLSYLSIWLFHKVEVLPLKELQGPKISHCTVKLQDLLSQCRGPQPMVSCINIIISLYITM